MATEAATVVLEDLSIEDLENLIASRKASDSPDASSDQNKAPSVKYIRNLRGSEVHFRLSRQSDPASKKTSLKPRGQRGDIIRLMPEDQHDTALIDQINYSLVEVISETEAREVMRKQSTNSRASHPALTGAITDQSGAPIHSAVIYDAPQPVVAGTVLAQSTRTQNPIVREAVAPQEYADATVARAPEVEGPAAGLPAGAVVTIAPVSTVSTQPTIPHL